MGRTTPTTRESIEERFPEWEDYRRALGRTYQQAFEAVGVAVLYRAHAGTAVRTMDVLWSIWLSIAVIQQREIEELQERVEELEAKNREI